MRIRFWLLVLYCLRPLVEKLINFLEDNLIGSLEGREKSQGCLCGGFQTQSRIRQHAPRGVAVAQNDSSGL